MATAVIPPPTRSTLSSRTTIAVMVAAAAMVATLPGRTHGLGLVTEPLMADLGLDRVSFAAINLWATLVGATFCVPWGWLLDRLPHRVVLAGTLVGIGAVVLAMAGLTADGPAVSLASPDMSNLAVEWVRVPALLFLLVLMTRGLGQSALSVVSLAVMGRAAGRRGGLVIGVYSFLTAVGFMAAFKAMTAALASGGAWREVWGGIGWALVASAIVPLFTLRSAPAAALDAANESASDGLTVRQALATPGFWVFALAVSFYGMVAAGASLFGQSLLAERNFDREVFYTVTVVSPLIGLAANLATGWLAGRLPLGRLLAAAMTILAASLLSFPAVSALWQVYAYAVGMGVAGGMVTVLFFAVWSRAYGQRQLGRIQGAAQLLTVLASAAGPLLLALVHRSAGAYGPLFSYLAAAAIVFAVAAWFVRLPAPDRACPDPEGET